jgi:uncharacterized protein (DUF608 family)
LKFSYYFKDPEDIPFENLNAYNFHDTKNWKDLNLKFILTVYRDYYHLKDLHYLNNMWPYIKELMITVQSQDYDNDGLIDSQGEPDQTYDAWSVTGASAFIQKSKNINSDYIIIISKSKVRAPTLAVFM